MSEAARYEARDRIGVITLDRPDNRNSMTPELLDAFARASAAARADAGIRALIVTGTGKCFSAGADLKAGLQRGDAAQAPADRSYAMYEPFLSLLDVEVPVVGALNGHAVGGGFGLALMCDLRGAAPGARDGHQPAASAAGRRPARLGAPVHRTAGRRRGGRTSGHREPR